VLPQINVVEAAPLHKRRDDALMSARERGVIVAMLRDIDAGVVVEIGTRDGRMAEIALLNVPGITQYIGIDVPDCSAVGDPDPLLHPDLPMEPGRYAKDLAGYQLLTPPHGSLDLTPEDLPVCDVMLIDGDHIRNAVMWDSSLARSRVRLGGLIIWHDYYPDAAHMHRTYGLPLDVTAVLDELAAHGADIQHIEDTWLAVARNGLPAARGEP